MRHCDKLAITVNPTNQCNLACTYCMANSSEETGRPLSIPLDFAQKGIEDALSGHPTGIQAQVLRFFSPGEPTLEMDAIKFCLALARELKPDIQCELQTNGLFLSPQHTQWIAENVDIVWFSLDGPSEINHVNRPDKDGRDRTAEIEGNLRVVKENALVGVRTTVDSNWFARQTELVEYYWSLGVKNLAFNPIIRPIKRAEGGTHLVTKHDVLKFAEGFLSAYALARKMGASLVCSLTFNFDQVTERACRSCVPMPQLNPDGSVSSCDMALFRDTKDVLKQFIYGEWDATQKSIAYDADKIGHLQRRTWDNIDKCKSCDIAQYCAGGCAGRVAYETGSIYDTIPAYCAATKYLARHIPLGLNEIAATHP